jgi:hypothetical protein
VYRCAGRFKPFWMMYRINGVYSWQFKFPLVETVVHLKFKCLCFCDFVVGKTLLEIYA